MDDSLKAVVGLFCMVALVAFIASASHLLFDHSATGAVASSAAAMTPARPTPAQDDAQPHQWWTAELFRQMGDCFTNGDSPAKEIKEEQARFEEPTVVTNRNGDGYTVSVEVHDRGSYYTYYRTKADCDAANPVHKANADSYQ